MQGSLSMNNFGPAMTVSLLLAIAPSFQAFMQTALCVWNLSKMRLTKHDTSPRSKQTTQWKLARGGAGSGVSRQPSAKRTQLWHYRTTSQELYCTMKPQER